MTMSQRDLREVAKGFIAEWASGREDIHPQRGARVSVPPDRPGLYLVLERTMKLPWIEREMPVTVVELVAPEILGHKPAVFYVLDGMARQLERIRTKYVVCHVCAGHPEEPPCEACHGFGGVDPEDER